jgi:uncharacterized membrane protein HdeD (DUF308 family)
MNANTEINRAVGWSVVLSVLMIIAGVLAIIMPPASGIAVTILVGWLMIFNGGAHIAYSWHTPGAGGVLWEILLGILYAFTGVYVLLHPMAGLVSLTLALAVYLFLESILEFILSYQLRSLSGSGWLLFDGVITLILAIMIWRTWPASTLWVVGTLVGVSMICSGVSRLAISLAARRLAHAS